MHHHEYKDKVFVLESKESEATRQIIQHIRLSVLMGFWLQLKHEVVMEWSGIM